MTCPCPGEDGPERPSCEKFISENHLSRRNTPRFENKMTCPGQGCPQMTELSCEKIQYLQHLSAHPVREAPPHPPTHFKKPGAVAVSPIHAFPFSACPKKNSYLFPRIFRF